jgi:hypothetical protein
MANLANDDLIKIIGNSLSSDNPAASNVSGQNGFTAKDYLSQTLESIQKLNFDEFEAKLMESSAALSLPMLLDLVISPLLDKVGARWHNGALQMSIAFQL